MENTWRFNQQVLLAQRSALEAKHQTLRNDVILVNLLQTRAHQRLKLPYKKPDVQRRNHTTEERLTV
jgi:hypothetical protein